MPEVVCNTSPLQYLHQTGMLRVLPTLYGRVLVPQAVADEIGVGLKAGVNLPDLSELDWLDVRVVANSPWPVPRDIHRGEAEVMALAGTLGDARVILDDLAARRHAKLLGLKCTGTLGILLKAKQAGILDSVAEVVGELERLGFRLTWVTRQEILKLAGED